MEYCRNYREGELAVGFVVEGGRLLTFERFEHGYRDIPGGSVAAGEEPKRTVIRRIEEELGVPVEAQGEAACLHTTWGGRGVQAHVIAARLLLGVPYQREEGIGGVRYMSEHELRRNKLSPVLDRLKKLIVGDELRLEPRTVD